MDDRFAQPRRLKRPQPEEEAQLVRHLLRCIDGRPIPGVMIDTLVWAAQFLLVEGVEVER